MGKTGKWEELFGQFSSEEELDMRIAELENNKLRTKEAYREHEKLITIKKNLPGIKKNASKIKHIQELRDKIHAKIDDIKALIELKKLDEEVAKLDEEVVKLDKEYKELQAKNKNPDLKPEEKADIEMKLKENQAKKQENKAKRQENNDRYIAQRSRCEDILKDGYEGKTLEELENELIELTQQRDICNVACEKLFEGKSWDDVEVALDKMKGRKLTAKGENAEKMRRNKDVARGRSTNAEKTITPEPEKSLYQRLKERFRKFMGATDTEKESTGLTVQSRWNRMTGAIKGFFNKLGEGINKFFTEEDIEKDETKTGSLVPEKENVEETSQEAFRKHLRKVAEIGIEGVVQESEDDKKLTKESALRKLISKYENIPDADKGVMENLRKQLAEIDTIKAKRTVSTGIASKDERI